MEFEENINSMKFGLNKNKNDYQEIAGEKLNFDQFSKSPSVNASNRINSRELKLSSFD